MSSNHQVTFPQLEVSVPFNAERMVNFIDRFTAMVVEKLRAWESDETNGERAPGTTVR
jgi:hypothetical protein